ncbi:hypothetical protein YPPY16_1552, partial [Yersinia pestis PY-16]
MLAVVAAVH